MSLEEEIIEAIKLLKMLAKSTGDESFCYISDDGRLLCSDTPDDYEELIEIFKPITDAK